MNLEVAKGGQVRSRARWMEEGETSSVYSFRLEKCGADRWISVIRSDDGTVVSSPVELWSSFAAFYKSLFSAAATDPIIRGLLLGNVSSSLSLDIVALSVRGISLLLNA